MNNPTFSPLTRLSSSKHLYSLAFAVSAIFASLLSQIVSAQSILPLGDSITDGFQVTGGYRTELYKRMTNAGASFSFLGSQTDNPSPTLTAGGQIHHEGIQVIARIRYTTIWWQVMGRAEIMVGIGSLVGTEPDARRFLPTSFCCTLEQMTAPKEKLSRPCITN